MKFTFRPLAVLASLGITAGLLSLAAPTATAATPVSMPRAAATDSFYSYTGSTPLSSFAPGAILKTRTITYHAVGIPLPLTAVQLLYRSTDLNGNPSANVTSVIKPPLLNTGKGKGKAISYQSAYDSLNPADSPSRSIAGDVSLGGLIASGETAVITPSLLQGYTVIVPDTEGPDAVFAAGPAYGTYTLDSARAALKSASTGLKSTTKIAMLGYSGGAIATGWAAQLAPSYAPDINKNLVGAAEGGLLVAPAHNLKYVSGSLVWAGVAPMAIIGVARAMNLDFTPYLSSYGQQVFAKLKYASISNALAQYPGLTWEKMAKPEYSNPNRIQIFVDAVNKVNRGQAASPTIPMFIAQGSNGVLEGTAGFGVGDGVMIAGDVRTLARQFCADGTTVQYDQYSLLSHFTGAVPWYLKALSWIDQRFAGTSAPNNCGSIAPGNSLAPEQVAP
ncbi:lipase family protein [Psychromicrobium sp. YIM B11713]|uniref:lipase family protein n=1 Tax=Psychromicrobium sp. YIM B11713 TaxID=3145233 RepID=UPI00374E36C0